jgi:hypothetical protein
MVFPWSSSLILIVSSSFPVVGIEVFVDYCWGGSQFEYKSCTHLAVREPTFLMVDSRKSIDAGKNETSPTTENSTIEN